MVEEEGGPDQDHQLSQAVGVLVQSGMRWLFPGEKSTGRQVSSHIAWLKTIKTNNDSPSWACYGL